MKPEKKDKHKTAKVELSKLTKQVEVRKYKMHYIEKNQYYHNE